MENPQMRMMSAHGLSCEEKGTDLHLRPRELGEFIGQAALVKNLKLMIASARIRQRPLDHILLFGPPGLGKTSLAYLMATELATNIHIISGPAVEKKGDLAATLTNLAPNDLLFIDEIHRLPIHIEELLYSAMEDYRLDIIVGQGAATRTMKIDLAPFTLIGATTRSGQLSRPLRDRFIAHLHFDFYSPTELAQILEMNARKMGVDLPDQARQILAQRCRGTPRIANRILRRVRDYALVYEQAAVTPEIVEQTLGLLGVDAQGLEEMDRKILETIQNQFKGGPVGIDSICATLNEERNTIEDVFEPYLLQSGLIQRTARGRVISEKGKKHLSTNGPVL